MEKIFDAPQIIARNEKHYGLENQHERGINYRELMKDSEGKFKRTDTKLETKQDKLVGEIKEGIVAVIMPSKSYIEAEKQKKFNQEFKAPAMIAKDAKTYGFEKQNESSLSYVELMREEKTWKRTTTRFETNPTDLAKEIKTGAAKVVLPHRDYIKQKEQEGQNQPQPTTQKEPVEVKPVPVKPLTERERKEVKEDMQKGLLVNNRHATILFKRFDRQLKSVPDRVNGTNLDKQDKLKLLVGDYSDHQNTRFSVNPEKTVQMGEKGVLTTAQAQYSEKQLQKQKLPPPQEPTKGWHL